MPGAPEGPTRCGVSLQSTVCAPDQLGNPPKTQPTSRDPGPGDRDIQISVIGYSVQARQRWASQKPNGDDELEYQPTGRQNLFARRSAFEEGAMVFDESLERTIKNRTHDFLRMAFHG
jgi:hypothetical protein